VPSSKDEWLRRIKDVEREHDAVRLAVDRFLIAASKDSALCANAATLRDVRRASDRLDGTYFIRLFAEFETGIRLFWNTIRATQPSTKDLIEAVAARRNVSSDMAATVQKVRDYRNSLVHEREEVTDPMTIADARRALCTFLSFLPRSW
jgi:hypothetical protein